jgi:hypothetical protein
MRREHVRDIGVPQPRVIVAWMMDLEAVAVNAHTPAHGHRPPRDVDDVTRPGWESSAAPATHREPCLFFDHPTK